MVSPKISSLFPVGSALLTTCKNADGDISLPKALNEMQSCGRKVSGGACGFWGSLGAATSSGMFLSIVTRGTPAAQEKWGMINLMTAASLGAIGTIGGPRCCKRNSCPAISESVSFAKGTLHIEIELSPIRFRLSSQNNPCNGKRCPFH